MKINFTKWSIVAFTFVGSLYTSLAQTYTGNINMTTQAEVDSIGGLGYTTIDGSIEIMNGNITDLTPFSDLTTLDSLTIQGNSMLISLDGLQNLTSVNTVFLALNENLNTLSSLSGLTEVTGFISYGNNSLSSLTGLENLTSANIILVQNNAGLLSLEGLNNVETCGSLNIHENAALETLEGLGNLTDVNYFNIKTNVNLKDFCPVTYFVTNYSSSTTFNIDENLYNPTDQDIIDGLCDYSMIGVLEDDLQNIVLSPNPTSGQIQLNLGSLNQFNIRVVNTLGQEVYTSTNITTPNFTFYLEAPKGMYMLNVESNGYTKQFKVIKQ